MAQQAPFERKLGQAFAQRLLSGFPPLHAVAQRGQGALKVLAALGTGNVVPGVLSMSLGTSGTLFAHADRPVVDDAGRWAAFCDSTGGWLPLICTMNCTVATETVAKLAGFSTRDGDAHRGDADR